MPTPILQSGGVAGLSTKFVVYDDGSAAILDATGATILSISSAGALTAAAGITGTAFTGPLASNNFVRATIAVADATGGATTAALTLTLTKEDGSALTSARQVLIFGSTLRYAANNPSSTLSYGSATAGSIKYAGPGYALIETNSAGYFACTATNSADETLRFMALSPHCVASADVAKSCVVVACNEDSATWSA